MLFFSLFLKEKKRSACSESTIAPDLCLLLSLRRARPTAARRQIPGDISLRIRLQRRTYRLSFPSMQRDKRAKALRACGRHPPGSATLKVGARGGRWAGRAAGSSGAVGARGRGRLVPARPARGPVRRGGGGGVRLPLRCGARCWRALLHGQRGRCLPSSPVSHPRDDHEGRRDCVRDNHSLLTH